MGCATGGTAGGPRALVATTAGAFGCFGVFWGAFGVLLADVARTLSLSPGPLGVALFAGAAASIAAMAALGWLSDRLARRAYLLATGLLFGVSVAGLAAVGSYAALVAVFVALYVSSGLYDVGINAVGADLERVTGRRWMPQLHAAFSAGATVGALGAGVLRQGGMDHRLIYLLTLVPLAVVLLSVCAVRFPARAGRGRGEEEGIGVGRWSAFGDRVLLLVASVACLGLLVEGELEHWTGIYLRSVLDLGPALGGSGAAVVYGAMAVGRLTGAVVVARFGSRGTLVRCGLVVCAGMLVALSTTSALLTVGGLLLVGLSLSMVVPIAFSVAGDLMPARAGAAVSVVATFGYGGFLLGPPLVGGLAELVGLRAALLVIAVAGAAIAALGRRLPRHEPEPAVTTVGQARP